MKQQLTEQLPTSVDILRMCPEIDCPTCKGSGKIKDRDEIGYQLRKMREKKGLSLRKMAKQMKISAAHLSDLELGQRGWSLHHISTFLRILENHTSK